MLQFSASTSCDEQPATGTYLWSVASPIGSSINESSGLYTAGAFDGTDTVTVIDKTNGDIIATAEVVVSPLWLTEYDKMWGDKKGENLFLLRAFRDGVLADHELGRDYIFMLYDNSLEILILFFQNPSLTDETKDVIDEMLPGIQSLLDGDEMAVSKMQVAALESLLTNFETKASPKLKTAIKKVKRDINRGEIFEQLGITISE